MNEQVIYNVQIVTPERVSHGFVRISPDGFISEVGEGEYGVGEPGVESRDGKGAMLLPGVIDTHVHFREPGLTHKATIASESRAAVAGGVTSYFDMPNTLPQTVTDAALEQKCEMAARDSAANYAFFIGATNSNVDSLLQMDYSRVPGIKLFMGSSTGNMLVDSGESLERLFAEAQVVVSVHAEDEATIARQREMILKKYGPDAPVDMHTVLRPAEACVKATRRAVELALRHGTRLNVAHITTAEELEILAEAKAKSPGQFSAEVSPHHLLWTEADYAVKGARIKMNPSVKRAADREALRCGVESGLVDIVATDHAPHQLAEKEGGVFKAVSGAPLVQFSLPAMLDLFSPQAVVRVMAQNPARRYGLARRGRIEPGNRADLALVRRLDAPKTIADGDALSLCAWTPMQGYSTLHEVEATWVNGQVAMDGGEVKPGVRGEQLLFVR